MLMGDLLKVTPQEHPDYHATHKGLAKVKEVAGNFYFFIYHYYYLHYRSKQKYSCYRCFVNNL